VVLRLLLGIIPVILFLVALLYLDSYKLVRPGRLLLIIGAGAAVAAASYAANLGILRATGIDLEILARYVAPVVEEIGKALVILLLIRTHRIGFLVDAAICGFAVGAGFAVVENVYYFGFLPDAPLAVWLVRGFGTAIMHGGTTAIVAIAGRAFADRNSRGSDRRVPLMLVLVPGLLLAVLVHGTFNRFILSPVLSTVGVLLALPPLVFLIFSRSEHSLQQWLNVGFDADTELLELIHSGGFSESRVGLYLQSLRDHFPGAVVADMLCYLRLHVELSLRAKGLLMMREAGFEVHLEPDLRSRLDELAFLDRSIGRTGKLAMAPFLQVGAREIWQMRMLGQ